MKIIHKSMQIDIDKVKNWKKNPRKIKDDDLQRLRKQISEIGMYKPLIVYKSGNHYAVLGGNMRLKALRELKKRKVWCTVIKPKDEKEKVEISLSDNDRAGYYVRDELADLISGFDLDLESFKLDLGIPKIDLSNFMDDWNAKNASGEDDFDQDKALQNLRYNVKRGDLFQLGEHRVLCGDATRKEDVERLMGDQTANLCLTDPPYSVEYKSKKKNPSRVLKSYVDPSNPTELLNRFMSFMPTEVLIMTYGGNHFHEYVRVCDKLGFETLYMLIWVKQSIVLNIHSAYNYQHEPVFIARKKGCKLYSNTPSNASTVIQISRKINNSIHPTERPLDLWKMLLRYHSKMGWLVYDPFLGSGTTLVACEDMDRICCGIELSPEFVSVIVTRWEDLTGKKAKKLDR